MKRLICRKKTLQEYTNPVTLVAANIKKIWMNSFRPHWVDCITKVMRYSLVSQPFRAPGEVI